MEGVPHIIYYGTVDAPSRHDAKMIIAMREYPMEISDRDFFLGCLQACIEMWIPKRFGEENAYTKEEWDEVIESRLGFFRRFGNKVKLLLDKIRYMW